MNIFKLIDQLKESKGRKFRFVSKEGPATRTLELTRYRTLADDIELELWSNTEDPRPNRGGGGLGFVYLSDLPGRLPLQGWKQLE